MLPNANYIPALFLEVPHHLPVPLDVSGDFTFPVINIRLWLPEASRALVPEAAIDKDREFPLLEPEIWLSKYAGLEPEARSPQGLL